MAADPARSRRALRWRWPGSLTATGAEALLAGAIRGDDAEFSRPFDVRQTDGRTLALTADAQECAALARRFGLVRIERLDSRGRR